MSARSTLARLPRSDNWLNGQVLPRGVRFGRGALEDDVHSWLASHGVVPSATVETIHERPWSTVMRVPTTGGDLYLKQEQPLQAYEVPLTIALASRWPDRVPEVVAVDTERSWLLLRDGGTRVADSGRYELFPRALALYGELQVGEVAHVDELLGFGLRDLRLPVVVDLYEPFFERDHGLEPDEVARLVALAARFRELCAELEELDLPASIQHDDLHEWNVFERDGRVAIYDWGDSSVGFPLWSWLKPWWSIEDREPALTAYAAAWGSFASEEKLRRALELAIPTGLFPYVLQIRRQYDATQAHSDYGTYLPQRLRQLLAALDAA